MINKKYLLYLLFLSLLSMLSFAAYAQEKNVSVDVVKMDESSSLFTLIILALLFIILLVLVILMLKYITLQQKKKRALREKVKLDVEEKEYIHEHKEDTSDLSMDSEVDKYLKADERQIVNILRQRGGICSQSTLRIAGNFSKATLSRLLMELEERNIIKKEKRGKKNLVILK